MKTENINIGQIYLIKGDNGGCCGKKCVNCRHFKGKMRVTNIITDMGFDERCVGGDSLIGDKKHCTFDPRDLVPLSWRDRYEN